MTKWIDQGENIGVNRHDTEGVTQFERDYIAPWTEESQRQFDEQVAGLPVEVHGRVRMLAQDQANFQLGERVDREDIADAVENVLKDPVAAGSDYQRYQSEPMFEEGPAQAISKDGRYHLFPVHREGPRVRMVDTLCDGEVEIFENWPTIEQAEETIRGYEEDHPDGVLDPEEEPAWDRDAVKLLMNWVQENPDWNTPDGIDLLMDEAENRSRVNGNDTVTEGDVPTDAFGARS